MAFEKGENPHHPQSGSTIKVDPIRSKADIARIKQMLEDSPRDRCLFIVGINTAFRANELLSICAGHVRYLNVGESMELKQSKTREFRRVTINGAAHAAIEALLETKTFYDSDPLFASQRRTGEALTVPTVTNLVKRWCMRAGLKGNYGSHSLRKTWGYWQYQNHTPIPLLMEAFGHQSQQQTLRYLGIQAPDIAQLYQMEL